MELALFALGLLERDLEGLNAIIERGFFSALFFGLLMLTHRSAGLKERGLKLIALKTKLLKCVFGFEHALTSLLGASRAAAAQEPELLHCIAHKDTAPLQLGAELYDLFAARFETAE